MGYYGTSIPDLEAAGHNQVSTRAAHIERDAGFSKTKIYGGILAEETDKLYDRENILVNRGCTSQRLSESTFVELEHPDQEEADQIVDPISLGSMEEVTMKVLPENIEVWLQ